jgi:hypothetical protein
MLNIDVVDVDRDVVMQPQAGYDALRDFVVRCSV